MTTLQNKAIAATASHTPGPWTAITPPSSTLTTRHIRSESGILVAEIGVGSNSSGSVFSDVANARLIAAAPELLAIARMAVSFARNTRENAESTNLLYTLGDAAHAAIAKATQA